MKVSKRKEQEEGTRFVRLVKKHPCLYNFNLPEYSQRDEIESAWRKIGEEMKVDDLKVLKEKWRNYRTVFLRRCKADKGGKSSKSPYYLMDEMKFVLDFIKVSVPLKSHRHSSGNAHPSTTNDSFTIYLPQDDDDQDMDETSAKTDLEVFQVSPDEQEAGEITTKTVFLSGETGI